MINDASVINIELDINAINENTKNILIIGGNNISGLFGYFYRDNLSGKVKENTEISKEYLYKNRYLNNLMFFKKCIDNNINIYLISSDTDAYTNYKYMIGFLIENSGKYSANMKIKKSKLFHHIKNINTEDDILLYLTKIIKRNMKFDYIIQNPPYAGTTHIKFLEKGLELLTDTGKMVIIEPATMYIDTRPVSNVTTLYRNIKHKIAPYVTKVIIDNYNKEFNINSFILFAITYIDKCNTQRNINFEIFKENRIVQNIFDCVFFGTYDILTSIIKKCQDYNDLMVNHKYVPSINVPSDTYFTRYAYVRSMNGPDSNVDYQQHSFGIFYNYGTLAVHKDKICTNVKPIQTNLNRTDTFCWLYGSKNEIDNFIYFSYHNKLPVFLSIITTIGQNNWVFRVLPWLVDKKYTDQEIYKILKFSNEEINIIEKCVMYYEKESPIFKQYMAGPSANITCEEVQKFINELNNGTV